MKGPAKTTLGLSVSICRMRKILVPSSQGS